MPRGARLDSPGTLHHVMIRGIERCDIIVDDKDRLDFVTRMGELAQKTKTDIYAWVLMTNHAHILLRSGEAGLSMYMRRLLSGYASAYNRRHNRFGHLFQNRYKSIICQEDLYFMELVRYIHLNPLRAGFVETLTELDSYKWCGHSVVMDRHKNESQNRDYVLSWFGGSEREAQKVYREFVKTGIDQGRRPELTGGGLIRSMGGWSVVKSLRKKRKPEESDDRILGNSDFVSKILDQTEEKVKQQIRMPDDLEDKINKELHNVCTQFNIEISMLRSGTRRHPVPQVRKIIAVKFVAQWGVSLAETARRLGVTTSAIAQILRRN
jgi:REP element-mobilizing transposase RayT